MTLRANEVSGRLTRPCTVGARPSAVEPRDEAPQGEREAGPDEHAAPRRHDSGDGLPGQAVVLAGVGKAQPRPETATRALVREGFPLCPRRLVASDGQGAAL